MASRRNYVTTTEVDTLAGISSTDQQISEAEELIDAFVGPQDKHFPYGDPQNGFTGMASAGGAQSLTLQTDQQNVYEKDYFKYCEVEIIGGTGAGQRQICTGSTKAGVLTLAADWGTAPDNTSFYRIYQLGKFPRKQDVILDTQHTTNTYYKSIPENVKRATAAQVEFMVAMGAKFFKTDKSEKNSERIGDYSYERSGGNSGAGGTDIRRLIGPKAKALLRGFINRTGEIIL